MEEENYINFTKYLSQVRFQNFKQLFKKNDIFFSVGAHRNLNKMQTVNKISLLLLIILYFFLSLFAGSPLCFP